MSAFEEKLARLQELIEKNESVRAYQAIEKKIKTIPELEYLVYDMKAYQQEAVFFKKIEKNNAYHTADRKAEQIEQELNLLPIVQDYRNKMQDASDLIQYVTKRLEEKINEELIK